MQDTEPGLPNRSHKIFLYPFAFFDFHKRLFF